jgi:hypothetical protein
VVGPAKFPPRPDGIIAFHEPAGDVNAGTVPTVALYSELEKSLNAAFSAMLPRAMSVAT